jgi:hypothetical protein
MRLIELQSDGEKRADGTRIWPGAYRVPRDMPEDLAARLVASGAAIDLTPANADKAAGRWSGATVVIAATGPSLTPEVAEQVEHAYDRVPPVKVIAVNDAYRLMPWADVLYACDAKWWNFHRPEFAGEKWAPRPWQKHVDNGDVGDEGKAELARDQGVTLIEARMSDRWSTDPSWITYGSNSTFQAVGLALHWIAPAGKIVLVGCDMRAVGKGKDAKRHFFGDHPEPLSNTADFRKFIPSFDAAAKHLAPGVEIINATPGSALKTFRSARLADALAD